MGEYVKLGGQRIKLGTCEDLYYVRYEQLKRLVFGMEKLGGNDEPEAYLKPEHGFRYRFPFPDEDEILLGMFNAYNRGYLVGVPMDFMADKEHKKICVSTACQNIYNVNHYITCPADKAWVKTCSDRSELAPLEIIQQKQVDGDLWVVCRCGWCGSAFRLPYEDAVKLTIYMPDDDFAVEVARRMLSGYGMEAILV
jgi:hypothetical protein